MEQSIKYMLVLLCAAGVAFADSDDKKEKPDSAEMAKFSAPVQLMVGDDKIVVESPGFAAPCWADMDGDKKKDLIVGQFNGGKMMVYRNIGAGEFAEGEWLKAGGETAEVPGVW